LKISNRATGYSINRNQVVKCVRNVQPEPAFGYANSKQALRNELVLARGESAVLDGTAVLSDDVVGGGEVAEIIQD